MSTDSADTIQTNLLSRLESSTEDDDEDNAPTAEGSAPVQEVEAAAFPSLLDSDPFASHTPPPSFHRRTASSTSAISATSSTMELDEPPSGATNLLDMSDDPPSIAMSDSFDHASSILSQFPPLQPDSPSFGERPTSAEFDIQTPRASMYQYQSTMPETPQTVREFPHTPSPPKADSPVARPSFSQHSRMPSETPTVRPGRQSPIKATPDSPENDRSLSPIASTPDASMYHTPRNETTREQSAAFFSFSQSGSPAAPYFPSLQNDDGYMPPFLVVDEEPRGSEVLNSAFTVPNNSLAMSSGQQSMVNPEDIIAQLQQKLELYESMSEQYESDISARDELVDELSMRIEKADEEVSAWRNEAERTTRRFEKMRHKIGALASTCEQLTSQRQQAALFDQASSVALQQLHQRVGSLDASRSALEDRVRVVEAERDDERERADQADREKDELRRKLNAAEKDSQVWQQRAREYERSGEELIEQLNSFHDASNASFNSSMMRPGSLSIMTIDEVVQGAKNVASPTVVDGRFPSADMDFFHLPTDNDPVYVLKSEIIKREQEYDELREKMRHLEFSSIEARAGADDKAKAEAQLADAQMKLAEMTVELNAQYDHVDNLQQEITCLEEEKLALETKTGELEKSVVVATRTESDEKEILAVELQAALDRVQQVEHERDEVRFYSHRQSMRAWR